MTHRTHNQRMEYGKTLVELGREDPRIVVLEADLGKSTQSCLFEKAFPERYFEMGIAEQNMLGFAGGLALAGKIPFVNTFAVFAAGRAYDQIRQSIGTAGLNVKIVGSSAGFSDFGDGATHQSLEDLALMSAIPGMTVLSPCDGPETVLAVREAARIQGPVYLRLSRNDVENVFPPEEKYTPGKPVVLREGTDLAVFTTGILASQALQAANEMEKQGVQVQVVHIPTLKPLEEEAVLPLARGKKGILICEEHSLRGGLGMLLCYLLRNLWVPKEVLAVEDRFGQSASSHEELLQAYGLDSRAMQEKLWKLWKG